MAKTGDVGTLRQEEDLEFYSHQLRGRLHFVSFETARMEDAVELIASNRLHRSVREMGCTGGGAHKFAGLFRERLAVGLRKHDEMDCLVRGLQFAGRAVVAEFFTYASPDREPALRSRQPRMSDFDEETMSMDSSSSHTVQDAELKQKELERRREKIQKQQEQKKKLSKKLQKDYNLKIHRPNTILSKYPYLIVSIGTGVSILKVEGPGRYERVSGSSVGGGTFYGLARALLAGGAPGAPAGAAAAFGYEDALGLARRGDSRNVDMLVGDIYGSGYDRFELSSDTVASSFGKLVNSKYMADLSRAPRREDFARGLLIMITMNIGQIAYLNAQLCKTKRIVFIGTFLRNNEISCQRLAFAIDYWSGGKMEALFMEHEGYLGALGAFLNSQNIIDETPQSTDGNQLPPARLTRSFSEASSYDRVFQQLPVHVREKIEKLRAKGGPVAAAAAPPKHNNSDEREATARPSGPPEEKETSTKNFMQRLHRTEPVMQQHRNSGNAAESEETTSLECFPENSDEECQLNIDDESQVLGGQAVFRTTL
uniref:pantothenate kinase n=1 Tax=Heterosigma akashiwo TaxID=2829 RepID=A0A7S4D8P4_HETAK